MNQPYETYKQQAIQTAAPGELTLMLYEGCLKFIGLGKKAIETADYEQKNVQLLKAQKIIQELMVTLRTEYQVAESMMQMYDYMQRRLIEANVKNDIALLEEVEEYVVEFRDTWKEVLRLHRKNRHREGGQA